jgi:hypothetical protein
MNRQMGAAQDLAEAVLSQHHRDLTEAGDTLKSALNS